MPVVDDNGIFMPDNEPELIRSPELLKQILEILPVGVWVIDRDGQILLGNSAARKIWEGVRYVGIEQYGEYKGWWRDTGIIQKGETSLDEEIEIECFDGSRKIILHSGVPVRDAAGEIIGGVIVNVDITERVRLEEKLRSAVDFDSLTQAYSRRRFYELLNNEIARANRHRRPLSLVMFDIDKFKQINDQYGHQAGDQVLASISRVTRSQIRESEHFARFGGDEFMLLLPEVKLDDAVRIVERLRMTLAANPVAAVGPVACSFGVCEYRPGDSTDELIRRADRALYNAKSSGRDRVSVCTPTSD